MAPWALLIGSAGAAQYPIMESGEHDRSEIPTVELSRAVAGENAKAGSAKARDGRAGDPGAAQRSQMHNAFIDRIASPIANKMFEYGMIP